MITLQNMMTWLKTLTEVYRDNKDYLTELDSAIGDADHGINMARGFTAVDAALESKPPATMDALFKTVSMTLIKSVGGASGPLYGTVFMKLGPLLGKGDTVSLETFLSGLTAGVEGIKKMGRSKGGEKTMLEAWLPALASLEQSVKEGQPEKQAFEAATQAAEEGMKATIPLMATKGRASYLGERSIGHQDPGATSTWLMLKALSESV